MSILKCNKCEVATMAVGSVVTGGIAFCGLFFGLKAFQHATKTLKSAQHLTQIQFYGMKILQPVSIGVIMGGGALFGIISLCVGIAACLESLKPCLNVSKNKADRICFHRFMYGPWGSVDQDKA